MSYLPATTKYYTNGRRNGYGHESFFIYFAQCTDNQGNNLIKIGSYNGKYRIEANLKSRYKMVFNVLKIIKNIEPISEQKLHIRFNHLIHELKYCNGTSSEFFKAKLELLNFIKELNNELSR